ncbi:MAG: PspC domain-containing protein [Caldilineaceae bacterium]
MSEDTFVGGAPVENGPVANEPVKNKTGESNNETKVSETVTNQTMMGNGSQQQTTGEAVSTTLFRHPTDKMIGGVCGGLADYLKWDPALVRIVWLGATIATGGGGLLAYLVLWGLLPVGTTQSGQQRPAAFAINERNIGRVAVVLIGLGGLWLLSNLGILPWLWHAFWAIVGLFFWPALLIGIGYLLLKGSGNAQLNLNLGEWQSRFQNRMSSVRMPRGENFKENLNQARSRITLKRSRSDRLFLGVCGGLGQRLGLDANLIRLLWAAFAVGTGGMGLLLYVILGLLLPEESVATPTTYNNHVQNVEIVEGTTPRVV